MSIETLKSRLPEYARDLRLNLGSLLAEPGLTEQQRAGTFLAAALATRNAEAIAAVAAEMTPRLTPEAQTAARTAAALMAMNNIYYRFTHLASAPDYRSMPAKLRMNALARPGVAQADFELWSLAVSAINGCGVCVDSHEKALRKAGVTPEAIQAAVRIAAVIHAIAVALEGEPALAA